jgi:hypothetical protein
MVVSIRLFWLLHSSTILRFGMNSFALMGRHIATVCHRTNGK